MLVVLDECHHAVGNHAYCTSIKVLQDEGYKPQILALSATPGRHHEAIQQVCMLGAGPGGLVKQCTAVKLKCGLHYCGAPVRNFLNS